MYEALHAQKARRKDECNLLVILELANNHMGDVELGKRIIREHAEVTKDYPQFQYAFKFQYRDLPTFIHPTADENHKYVKRFRETNLSRTDRLVLKGFAEGLGFKQRVPRLMSNQSLT